MRADALNQSPFAEGGMNNKSQRGSRAGQAVLCPRQMGLEIRTVTNRPTAPCTGALAVPRPHHPLRPGTGALRRRDTAAAKASAASFSTKNLAHNKLPPRTLIGCKLCSVLTVWRRRTNHMSSNNSLGILTGQIGPNGQKRLFAFLDVVNTDVAARFREWLGAASDAQMRAAADIFNRASHLSEIQEWWQLQDPAADATRTPGLSRPRPPLPKDQGYRVHRDRGIGNAGIPLIILGYVLMVAGNFMALIPDAGAVIGLLLSLIGLLVHVAGCTKYAEAKGHSKLMGLLGLLTCVGLVILLMLPVRDTGARRGRR